MMSCVFYNLCEVFVFPSFYEGFGFPIVSLQLRRRRHRQCLVVSRDRRSAALIVNPYNP